MVNGLDPLLMGALGGVAGLGIVIALAGARGVSVLPAASVSSARHWVAADRMLLRISLAVGAALLAAITTRWLAAAVAAAVAGYWSPSVRDASGRHAREVAKVEAVATWVEQVRDTLSAANGLEHAIAATAALARPPIAPAVERLAARSTLETPGAALREFAEEVDHPLADFVAAALIAASEHHARELTPLLSELATAARDEARMRTRVWVGRARTRTAVRVTAVTVVGMVVSLLVLDRDYLRAYDSLTGQMVLAVIVAAFGAALVWMERMGRLWMPQRFVRRRSVEYPS